MKNSMIYLVIATAVIMLLTNCANHVDYNITEIAKTYGFWGGLWHGMIAPFSFIGSLFNDDIVVYAVNNNGGWYTFGFLLGVGGLSGSAASS